MTSSPEGTGSPKKILGVIKDLFAQPLILALEQNRIVHPFTVQYSSLAENAQKLLSGEVDIALISPIDYAKHTSDWELVPGIGISSYGITGAAKLLFKPGLNKIESVAVDLRFPTEMILTQIVFLEKYQVKPRFISQRIEPGKIPDNVDAVLLIGDNAFITADEHQNVIDLSDEWNDLTYLPFVHAVIAGKRNSITQTDVAIFIQGLSYFSDNKDQIIEHLTAKYSLDKEQLAAHLIEEMRYTLDELDIDGMKEFFRHCFYHSILDEIPDFHFTRHTSPDKSSLN